MALIALMGISILGIVIVQLVWMNNTIRVKNELFDRSVNEALANTSNRLDNMQDLRMINHFSWGDSSHWHKFEGFPSPPPKLEIPGQHPKRIIKPKVQPKPTSQYIEMIEKAAKKHGFQYHISSKSDSASEQTEENIIIVNSDSVAKNKDSVYAQGLHKFDSLPLEIYHLQDSNGQLRQRYDSKTLRLKQMHHKVVEEITSWEQNELPMKEIHEILKKELVDRGIPIPFEYGILGDSLISKKTRQADPLLLANSLYKANLFPNSITHKYLRLSVYFPQKDSFIYKTLNWLLLISLIFSIIVLVTFCFSIYFILKQKKISEMNSDFINNMTHEFKTPITTISVAADSIVNQKIIDNPERVRYYIEMIKKENARMNQQVEDILTIARLDNKDFEFKWEAVNLHEVIKGAIQSIVIQVEKKGGSVTSALMAANPLATSDLSHFANMIYNLLDNANKYSLNAPDIHILTRNTAKGVLIVVKDKGIGMTKAVQNRIFERFYRQNSGNIQNVKGFGLGLSYVKAVVEANRGRIAVYSELGKGSRFEVFIPFVRE